MDAGRRRDRHESTPRRDVFPELAECEQLCDCVADRVRSHHQHELATGKRGLRKRRVADILRNLVAWWPRFHLMPRRSMGETQRHLYSNVDNGFIEMNPFFTNSGGGADGQGFQQVTTSAGFVFSNSAGAPGGLAPCPSNPYAVTGMVCTTVNVSGDPLINPHGPTETGNPGEYITAQPGDILCVNCTEVSAGENSNELIRILVKNSSTNWIVQRAFQYGVSCSTQVCGGSPAPLTSKPNPTLTYVVYSPGWREWDFVNDPSMQNLSTCMDWDRTTSCAGVSMWSLRARPLRPTACRTAHTRLPTFPGQRYRQG